MRVLFLILLFSSLHFTVAAQHPAYMRVKIYTDSKSPAELMATGIEINQIDIRNKWCIAEISQDDLNSVIAAGFQYEVVIPDMAKYYTSRFHQATESGKNDKLLNETWPQPVNFSLGSCGGFSTVDQMIAQLDLMRTLFPSLISVKERLSDTVTTIEGRNIYYVRISDNPDVKENEPEVLYTGMHHAREPIGMQHLLYYMWYLLENYNTDPSVKDLVDNTEMYFVPVINVDGYIYNITTNPNGGGNWRKNRRVNAGGSFGVDINRNYGYKWGNDNTGSSPTPSSDTYRGNAPFSEPETRMMKYFCEDHDFGIALNYHSYSNLLLYAWGWTSTPCPDDELFDAYSIQMTKENNYTYGPGSTTIYPTNGGSDDWMYGETVTKPAILAYTPEVGNNYDGFWPQQSRIIPLIQENMLASITAARLVGKYGIVSDNSSLFIWNQTGYLPFDVKRLGLKDGSFTVSVIPLGNDFAAIGDPLEIQGLSVLETRTDSISYQFNNTIQVGDTIQYVIALNNGYFSVYDTVTRIIGYPVSIFSDNIANAANWTGSWGITNAQYYSPTACMTDSPLGNYQPYANKTTTLVNEININNTLLTVLEFRAKWAIEKGYDYVQLSISNDNGTTWQPLAGRYTHPGSTSQAYGQPVYDGKTSKWLREAISLNPYMGNNVKFRFKLVADGGVELDGFYFDDFNIYTLLDPTPVEKPGALTPVTGIPFPNPARGTFELSYNLPLPVSEAWLTITSATGKEVSRTHIPNPSGTIKPDIQFLAPGVYFISVVTERAKSQVQKLIVY